MKTPRELNGPGSDNNFDDQNLPERIGRSESGSGADRADSDPIELNGKENGGFFSGIDTSFPLSGGETEEDLYRVLHNDDANEEFKRTPNEPIELNDDNLHIDDDDYLLNDGE